MKPVLQTRVHEEHGDCQRAVIASLLELDAEQVPNFTLFPDPEWWWVLHYFLYALGWHLEGCLNPPFNGIFNSKMDEHGIDGYHYAAVLSKTFAARVTHAVVIDRQGNVAHDPNPNQLWAGKNVFEDGLLTVYLIRKRTDEKADQETPGEEADQEEGGQGQVRSTGLA